MADLMTRMYEQLRIRGDKHGRMTRKERAQSELGLRVLAILQTHAPRIAAMAPDAPWDSIAQESLLTALKTQFPTDALFDRAHDLVARVLRLGKAAEIWIHEPWPRRRRAKPERGLLGRRDLKLLGQSHRRKLALIENLPGILASRDPHVVGGAALVAATDISGLLLPALHAQIVDPATPTWRYEYLSWVDFKIGEVAEEKHGKRRRLPWRNPRRWILDNVSLLLRVRLIEIAKKPLDVARCLAAYSRFIGIEPIDPQNLMRSARAEWITRVPALLITYATNPAIAPSLPAHAFARLVVGRPLPPGVAPLAPRRLAALAAAEAARELREEQAANDQQDDTTSVADIDAQTTAIEALARTLRKLPKGDTAAEELERSLSEWDVEHANSGEWPTLIRYWISDTLLIQKKDPYSRGDGWPRVPGMLRYTDGFAKRWIRHFHDIPVARIKDDPESLADRVRRLIFDIAKISSADVSHTGLTHFLMFLADTGGPRILVRRDGDVVVSPRDADANLLTPAEFTALLAAIDEIADAHDRQRVRVIAILAYRLGLRWGELAAIQIRDIRFDEGLAGQIEALLKVREKENFKLKTASSRRWLSLADSLSKDEITTLIGFIRDASKLGYGKRNPTDYLFADLDALHLEPREPRTHDLIQQLMRDVSGDPTLTFHALRHAAANAMLWRLFMEDIADTEALAWLPSAGIVTAPGIGYEGAWMTAVTGRPANHPSRIYVISQALGHLGPGTSMTSYLHGLEFLMHQEATKHLDVPDEVAAALEGVDTDSIRRRRSRGVNPLKKSLQAARESISCISSLWDATRK